jgi:hypothetical protein
VIRISGFEAPSAIGDKPAGSQAGFTLTPNPTEGPVKIEIAESGDEGCYEIYNTLGESVNYQVFSGDGIYEFDLSDQPDGIYIVRVQNGETVMSRKIVKN